MNLGKGYMDILHYSYCNFYVSLKLFSYRNFKCKKKRTGFTSYCGRKRVPSPCQMILAPGGSGRVEPSITNEMCVRCADLITPGLAPGPHIHAHPVFTVCLVGLGSFTW